VIRTDRPAGIGAPRATIAFGLFGAAAIHAAVIESHLEEAAPSAAFFAVLAVVQLSLALLVVARDARSVTGLAVATSAFAALLWTVTRLTSLPGLGVAAEPVDLPGGVATAYELAVIAGAVVDRRAAPGATERRTAPWVIGSSAFVAGASLLVTLVGAGEEHRGHSAVHLLFVAPAFVAFMAYAALETRRGALGPADPRTIARPLIRGCPGRGLASTLRYSSRSICWSRAIRASSAGASRIGSPSTDRRGGSAIVRWSAAAFAASHFGSFAWRAFRSCIIARKHDGRAGRPEVLCESRGNRVRVGQGDHHGLRDPRARRMGQQSSGSRGEPARQHGAHVG
jgi:hypothetical protein